MKFKLNGFNITYTSLQSHMTVRQRRSWVQDDLYIIIVPDDSTAEKILKQVPWAVMK